MVNVPLDMLVFFMYKMRMDILENSLDIHDIYADMKFDDFIAELNACFDKYTVAGATELNIVHGKKIGTTNIVYGFECTELQEDLPFIIECLEDNYTVIGIHKNEGFNKTGNVRSHLAL